MANETFSYTNSSSSTKTLTFATSGHSINDTDSIEPNQVSQLTMGGVRLIGNIGSAVKKYEYTCVVPTSSVSETDYADVIEFIGTTYINYGQNAFTWTDYNSNALTVRMVNDFQASNVGAYKKITFVLEVQNS